MDDSSEDRLGAVWGDSDQIQNQCPPMSAFFRYPNSPTPDP